MAKGTKEDKDARRSSKNQGKVIISIKKKPQKPEKKVKNAKAKAGDVNPEEANEEYKEIQDQEMAEEGDDQEFSIDVENVLDAISTKGAGAQNRVQPPVVLPDGRSNSKWSYSFSMDPRY